MNALSARPQAVRAPRGAVACRATKVAKLDFSRWKAINVTKMNLIESQGGRTTRNIDGSVYDISYEAGSDVVVVVDRQKGLRYPAMVGEDNRVRIDLESGEAAAVGLSLEPLQQVLSGDSVGAELVNGRTAMVAFIACAIKELASGASTVQQLASPAGAALAIVVSAAVLAASVAPAATGKVAAQQLFPSDNDPYADRLLPVFWNALAEKINGRVAMVGFAGLLINELLRGSALL